MIKHIKHKGLKKFYETGNASGIQARHIKRLQLILARLEVSLIPQDMDLPGLKLHKLIGDLKEFYSVTVQANWRVVFQFKQCDIYEIDYIDYH